MQPGDLFEGRYQIEAEVGRGAFGIVYRVTDNTNGESLALKVLLPWASQDRELRHRLEREAKLASQLNHPHAIRIDRVAVTAAGQVYVVMEFLQGRVLSRVLEDHETFPPERVTDIARQVLDALAAAHELGVVHRDLKPQNIFLCPGPGGRDRVKVFDFGIAKVISTADGGGLQETTKLTVRGGVLGTPVYMSPEQCRGEELTGASDMYSLGVVLYEMLTGRPPFDDPNPVQVMIMHNSRPVPPLPAALRDTPLGQAVLRALARQPAERFARASEFAAALASPAAAPAREAGAEPGLAPPRAAAVTAGSAPAAAATGSSGPSAGSAVGPAAARRVPMAASPGSRSLAGSRPGAAGLDWRRFMARYWFGLVILAVLAWVIWELL